MEMIVCNFLVIVILNLGSAEYIEVFASTFTSILNRNYTEDKMSVSSKIECTMFYLNTNFCEAIYYDKSAGDSRCLLRKYSTNILYPLIINTSLPSNLPVLFLRTHDDNFMVPPGYQFEPDLLFWYKLVENHTLTALDAREDCRQDKAYLLLIDDDSQYNFIQNLLGSEMLHGSPGGSWTPVESSILTVYIQGVRTTRNDPYLDEIGRVMTYDKNWNVEGLQGPGKYMRFVRSWIETSKGTAKRAYICQVRLN